MRKSRWYCLELVSVVTGHWIQKTDFWRRKGLKSSWKNLWGNLVYTLNDNKICKQSRRDVLRLLFWNAISKPTYWHVPSNTEAIIPIITLATVTFGMVEDNILEYRINPQIFCHILASNQYKNNIKLASFLVSIEQQVVSYRWVPFLYSYQANLKKTLAFLDFLIFN